MMTKTQIKHLAQEELLGWAAQAMTAAQDAGQNQEYIDQLRKQYRRIEKLFGIVPGSTPI